jgi:OOP family OmpA-OmpF porin
MRRRSWLALVALLAVPFAPLSAQRLYRVELGAAGGYHFFGDKLDLASAFGGAIRAGYWFHNPFSVEADVTFAHPKTDTPLKRSVGTSAFGLWGLANFPAGKSTSFFVKGGYGRTSYGSCPKVSVPGAGPCGSTGALQTGLGMRLALKPTIFMRYEAALSRSLGSASVTNAALQGGVSIMLKSQPLVDSDGDGVFDRYDQCAETRLGALVDKRGCPTDRDNDGVADGLDRCPGTPTGAAVDAAGCTQDSDEDGVLDGIDTCPDTPKGAAVDSTGCPSDSDGDGVLDGLDRCPVTPHGATVDELGCPGDADGDGVLDGLDRCPETLIGTIVDTNGCAIGAAPPPTDSLAGERTWILPGTVWALRGSTLSPDAFPVLDSVVAVLQGDPTTQAVVNGFAQDRLVPSDNTRLSQRRAETVRDYIASKGVPVIRITAAGKGSQTLIVSDTTEAARVTNRRVEIRVTRNP